jgi:hypothetical protein
MRPLLWAGGRQGLAMTQSELRALGQRLEAIEHEAQEIKARIVQGLGLRDLIGYGSIVKIDWAKIKRGWYSERITGLLTRE